MTTNLFVIANVKQLRSGGSFKILLPFYRTSWGVGVLNSAIFNGFHNRVGFGTISEDLRNFGGGGVLNPPLCTPLSGILANLRICESGAVLKPLRKCSNNRLMMGLNNRKQEKEFWNP